MALRRNCSAPFFRFRGCPILSPAFGERVGYEGRGTNYVEAISQICFEGARLLQAEGKTRFARVLCQGTTSVVPRRRLFVLSRAGFSRRQTCVADFSRSLFPPCRRARFCLEGAWLSRADRVVHSCHLARASVPSLISPHSNPRALASLRYNRTHGPNAHTTLIRDPYAPHLAPLARWYRRLWSGRV